jgi:hypothetical protein
MEYNVHDEFELDEYEYAVEICGSDGFWLASFTTEREAKEYIKDHNLREGEKV